jgi:hypothetical protein
MQSLVVVRRQTESKEIKKDMPIRRENRKECHGEGGKQKNKRIKNGETGRLIPDVFQVAVAY